MNKFWITLGLAFTLSTAVFAQDSILLRTEKVWYNDSKEDTGIFGVNTEKAYQFLKEHNRKPTELVVAVIDGGVQADHIDLKDNMWVNQKEIAGNGKDDDKNGYVDDINGWNFIGGANGENVNGDTLEKVRVYKYSYLPLFESEDSAKNEENKKKYPTEFADYEKVKKEITDEINKAKSGFAQYTQLKKMADTSFPALVKDFGSALLSEESLGKYTPTDETMPAMQMFAFLPKELWEGKSMQEFYDFIGEQFSEGIYYFDKQVKYNYNLDFEPRNIVGDDYNNKKENKYGNNNVEGPDASHGTHVAGLISAVRDNNKGIDGIAGNNVKIMGVRTVPNGDERDKDVANAIRYAADNGAKIFNMSFGKDHSTDKELVWDAMKYAEKKGVLMVKAAGNDGVNIDTDIHYPTNFDEKGNKVVESIITVGASTPDSKSLVASFSNFGKKSVDVFAPGTEILSTVPHNEFKEEQGTSMASPITAGVAALVWSHYPKLTALEVKDIIMKSVNTDPQLTDISVSGGVIDAYKAVQLAEEMYKGKK